MKAKHTTLLIAVALMSASCAQMEYAHEEQGFVKTSTSDKEVIAFRTPDIEVFAKALSASLRENPSLVHEIREHALKKFDGDYDILYRDLAAVEVDAAVTKGGSRMSVGELLRCNLETLVPTKSASDFLVQLQENYPLLQVSVPVHAEDLTDDMIPTVVYVPAGIPESQIDYVFGYDSFGDEILMDANNDPSEPVIVIGQNERVGHSSELMPIVGSPTNLTGTVSSNSIILTWDVAEQAAGYRLYRKAQGESDFSIAGSVFGMDNTSYEDTNLVANEYYTYYVKAVIPIFSGNGISSIMESRPSNIIVVQAPQVPPALSSFTVGCVGRRLEAKWSNDGLTNYSVDIWMRDPLEDDGEYCPFSAFSGTASRFVFDPEYRGRKMDFMAFRTNNMGASDPVYDFIYPPFRNTSSDSPVFVSSISFDDLNELEKWISGAPEFYLKVIGSLTGETAHDLYGDIEFAFDSRTTSQSFHRLVHSWPYLSDASWYSSISFAMIEGDTNITQQISVPVKVAVKIDGLLDISAGFTYSATFQSNGQVCGATYMMYYNNSVATKQFPNHNVRMSVTEY